MQLLFVDESGTPPKPGQQRPTFFTLGGVVIAEGVWHRMRDTLFQLKSDAGVRGELKWRYFSPANTDSDNPLSHLSQMQKDELRIKLFEAINRVQSVKIIAVVIDAAKAYDKRFISTQEDLYLMAYKQITERFQYYLQDIFKSTGVEENGIVVCDHRGKDDDARLRAMHDRLMNRDKQNYATYKNLIECAFMAPSHLGVGIQYADMVAGAVNRRFESNDESFFNALNPSFRKAPNGKIEGFGLVVWPKPHRRG